MGIHNVVDVSGNTISELELDERIFSCEIKEHLLHDAVRYHLAKKRSGTASTKNRSLVAGGGAKPWRQKGRGRARVGTIRSPLWRGGGVVFGPTPRSYDLHLPKKVRRGALRSALSLKYRDGKLLVLDRLEVNEFKTKAFVKVLEGLGLKEALFVVDELPITLERSARNVPGIKILRWPYLNTYDVLKYDMLVFLKEAIPRIEEALSK